MLRIERRPRRSWVAALIGVVCVGLPACGFSHGPDFAIGFRRVALDLSYKDESLATPPTHEDVVIPQPVVSNGAFVTFQLPPVTLPSRPQPTTPTPRVPIDTCPTAGPDEHPDQ
ncbi:MAG: hypothetical protein QOG64_2423, partial [Acidimicrobiaceae bacterium]|nr:hypothetical protein [Acidimicrobiaceae bacterium]